jgi:glyceraldehyde 3-phosphate dehydrogenase
MRVFINGFGRIGRSVLRAYLQAPDKWPGLQIVGINDIAAAEMCAYLFEFDSVFGPWRGTVALESGALVVDGRRVPLHRTADLSMLDLSGVDLVMECTGRAEESEVAERGLRAGAARVLISGPSSAAEVTVVLGANEAVLGGQKIVSNASCTTNALAPLARLIHERWGIVTGSMTTVHCYTGSQPTVDAPAADYPRSRAAALSMVPTTTSAARLLDGVLPELAGRIVAQAVRVPVASVSCVDFHLVTEKRPSVEEVNAAFRTAARSEGAVIGATDRALVSTDLRARGESVVMACPETKVTAGGMLRVFGWYDNEWGFSNRMLDMAVRMG